MPPKSLTRRLDFAARFVSATIERPFFAALRRAVAPPAQTTTQAPPPALPLPRAA